MKQDFTKRISVVLNKQLPSWQVLNTLAHISAYFGHYLGENFDSGQFFVTQDGKNLPRNSQYPIIIFEAGAKEIQKFATLMQEQSDLQVMYFFREMIETSNDKEIEDILATKDFTDLEILGVGIFGENSLVKSLTRQFTLWS